jgi:hypothetical protein
MNEIKVAVSPGELLDKITILRIKSQRMNDPAKVANVRRELHDLQATWGASAFAKINIEADVNALLRVNERLWDIEDDIRDKERAQAFDAEFIRLARAVYFENDERAAIKRRINAALGSSIVEEKSYREYKP